VISYPIIRLFAAFSLMAIAGSTMYASIVALNDYAVEFDATRAVASAPYMAFMLGFGVGGLFMGRAADRFGVMVPNIVGAFCVPAGFIAAAYSSGIWQLCLATGVLMGMFGASATFGPLVADISHWFTRRRGLALGIVISGSYMAGAVWPTIMQHFIDLHGWRDTFIRFGMFTACAMPPLIAVLYRKPPPITPTPSSKVTPDLTVRVRPLDMSVNGVQSLICLAGMGCCIAMSMPQVHIVAYAIDLGFTPAHGAEMLSLMLTFGIVSRLTSGWISDRIGGFRTLILGSTLQMMVLPTFLLADTLSALYLASAAFGLSQGGIVPSYALISRAVFPATDAGWRISAALLSTLVGMAVGGWMAGALYDLTGSYTISFLNGVVFNVINLAIAVTLYRRARRHPETLHAVATA
jgi:MFS family permease